MARDNDRIDSRIACLRTEDLPATLISDDGYHCEVWRSSGSLFRDGLRQPLDLVVKVPRQTISESEVRVLNREHRQIREQLGDIVPITVFARTTIDDQPSMIAMAPNIRRWFDVANPIHEDEIKPLIGQSNRLRQALRHFVDAAEHWYATEHKVIDLYGRDNLIFDRNRHLHYIDSFSVFFYADLLSVLPDPEPGLVERIRISRERLGYLHHLLGDDA